MKTQPEQMIDSAGGIVTQPDFGALVTFPESVRAHLHAVKHSLNGAPGLLVTVLKVPSMTRYDLAFFRNN
jgi:hypothetical protein